MNAASESLIEFRQVHVSFSNQEVLRGIDLDLRRGETTVVIGESGCGKTVLLKLIVGLLTPTSGKVLFEGKSPSQLRNRELTALRLRVGYLFQGGALFDSLNVEENIAFGPRAKGLPEIEVHKRVETRLQEVGLPLAALSQMPSELSGGMKKRAALARALALDPEVMLYDEPTTGLDPIMSDIIDTLILQTRQHRKITSVVVTHDMKTVAKVADRVVMLFPVARLKIGESQVLFDGSPTELNACEDPRVRQFIIGDARERLRQEMI